MALLLTEPSVPGEQLGPLGGGVGASDAFDGADAPGDPTQGGRVPVEPTHDPRRFQDEPGFDDGPVVYVSSGGPVGRLGRRVVAGVVVRVAQGLGEIAISPSSTAASCRAAPKARS